MGDDELAELRRRKLAQLQQQAYEQQLMQEEAERQRQLDAQIHTVLLQIMEPAARERLNAIRLTRPDFARAVEQQLVLLAKSGRLTQKITDEQLKAILQQLQPARKDFKIIRKG
ncbi:MAG: DNA-binding protein [Methanolinea sp.]|nr:DNA-binding protein [Methanolinea sp.]